jgi:GNAT superfamily N-acetyltransferase
MKRQYRGADTEPDDMAEPTIRAYEPSDAADIIGLVTDYRAEQPGQVADRDAIAAALTSFAASTQDRILVAELAGKLAGYVGFHFVPFPMIQGVEAYVSELLVASEVRGSGIGDLLLRAVEDEARARGCVRLMLNNHKTDLSYARAFYAKRAFRERADFANFVKPLR